MVDEDVRPVHVSGNAAELAGSVFCQLLVRRCQVARSSSPPTQTYGGVRQRTLLLEVFVFLCSRVRPWVRGWLP